MNRAICEEECGQYLVKPVQYAMLTMLNEQRNLTQFARLTRQGPTKPWAWLTCDGSKVLG